MKTPIQTPTPTPNIQNKFDKLNNAFEELNNLINIDEMTNLILTLNTQLKYCNNKYEQFIIYNEFYTKLACQNV